MRKAVLCASLFAALTIPHEAQANGSLWTMPYSSGVCAGNCFDIFATNGTGIWSHGGALGIEGRSTNGTGIYARSINGIGLRAESSNTYGIDSTGFVAVRGAGVIGLQGSGVTFGLETGGNTAPINLVGTIPANPQNPLCKSTAGNSAGHIGTCSSTRALKEGIVDLDMSTDTLMRLRPVAFRWKSNHSPDLGFVAEDVAKVNRLLAVYNERGELQSVKYTQMTALLTKVLQEQVRERTKVEGDFRKRVDELQQQNTDLTTQLQKQRTDFAAQLRQQEKLIQALTVRLGAVEQRGAALK
jgi:hypothetical protein